MSDHYDEAYENWLELNLEALNDEYFNLGHTHRVEPGDADTNLEKDTGFQNYVWEKFDEYEEEAESKYLNSFKE